MRRFNLIKIIVSLTAATMLLSACKKTEIAPKTSFGRVDPLVDGQVLLDNSDGSVNVTKKKEEVKEEIRPVSSLKTAKQLDVENLPDDIKRMTGLCDAINITCVEKRSLYNDSAPDFIWHCIDVYANICDDPYLGFKAVGDTIDADPDVITNVLYAMFGNISGIPDLSQTSDEENIDNIVISNDLHYRFMAGDRGLSAPEIKRVMSYSDGSMEMEVALNDSETGEEIVSFIYTLGDNKRDSTTTALFKYEINDVKPADRMTSDKMSGRPFLTDVVQVYGYESADASDPAYGEVKEILYFTSFSDHVPGMDVLNERISRELVELSDSDLPDGTYHLIRSYPLTLGDYVQFAATIDTYPQSGENFDIRSYNYDIRKQRVMDINDAFTVSGIPESDLTQEVLSAWKEKHPDTEAAAVLYKGFLIRVDGSVDFYMELLRADAKTVSLVSYNSLSKEFGDIRESVIPVSEEDKLLPPLTHGRKEE